MESDKYLLSVYRTRIAHTERVAMSTNTKEVRRFALIISAITSITLVLSGCSSPQAQVVDKYPKTTQFVVDSFENGQYLTPFEPGKAEIGLTLEALINLSQLGSSAKDLQKQTDWVRANTDKLTSPGLRAQYIVASHAVGFANDSTVGNALSALKAEISPDGDIEGINNFAYSWVLLALIASQETELANKVAVRLITKAEVSGGYKYAKGDTSSFEAADVTSLALMAVKVSLGIGSAEDETAKNFSVERSKQWLLNNLVEGTHFEAYDNLDLGGTSYGIMALTSVGEDSTKLNLWLAAKINKEDAGIASPYSAKASDVFTTVQALLPLSSFTLVDVMTKINFERNKDNT